MERTLGLVFVLMACGDKAAETDLGEDGDGDGFPAMVDCDDKDKDIHPDADEVCDGADNDCDDRVDEEDATDASTWYPDLDQDGFGDPRYPEQLCGEPDGYVRDGTDCDDLDPARIPGADEVCDGVDNDCDGFVDDEDPELVGDTLQVFYRDADGDGYGNPEQSTETCLVPDGFTEDATDCNDNTALAHPDADEVCNDGLDNDCDGTANGCGLTGTYTASEVDGGLKGTDESGYAGYASAGAGDTNADGIGDFLVGGYRADGSTADSGVAWLVTQTFGTGESLDDVGWRLEGDGGSDYAGWAVDGGGDLNGDGYDDVLVGAPYFDGGTTDNGILYGVFGPISGDIALESQADLRIVGKNSSDYAGFSVALLDDVSGNGKADILVGAYGEDSNGSNSGTAYFFEGDISDSVGIGTADAKFAGQSTSDGAGYAVSRAGDVDGDGNNDLWVGAQGNDTYASSGGALYLVRGPVAGNLGLSGADAKWYGDSSNDQVGRTFSGGGDLNNDGYSDVVIGTYYRSSQAGAVWVVYGPTSGTNQLSEAAATITGVNSSDYFGWSVDIGGDVNADGRTDLVVGAQYADPGGASNAGAAYFFSGPISGSFVADSADATFEGRRNDDYTGSSVAIVPDVHGDGFDELLFGAYGEDSGATNAGSVLMLYGEGL